MMPFDSDTHEYLEEQRQLGSCLSKNLTDTTLDSDSPCAVYKGPPPEAGCQDENNIANKSTMSFTLGRMKWAAHAERPLIIQAHYKLSESGSYHYYSKAFALKKFWNCIRLAGGQGKGTRRSSVEPLGQEDKGLEVWVRNSMRSQQPQSLTGKALGGREGPEWQRWGQQPHGVAFARIRQNYETAK